MRRASVVIPATLALFGVACSATNPMGDAADASLGPVTVLWSSTQGLPIALAASDGYVAWLDYSGSVGWVKATGGAPASVLLDDGGPGESINNSFGLIAMGRSFFAAVFYHGEVFRTDLPSGTLTRLVGANAAMVCTNLSAPCGQVAALAADQTNVYLTSNDGPDLEVWKLPLAGGNPTKLASVRPQNAVLAIEALAVDAGHVYWSVNDGSSQSIQSVPIAGGAPATLAANERAALAGLAIDTKYLYWLGGSAGAKPAFVVRRIPLAGGAPEDFASGSDPGDTPCALATDGRNVYWSTSTRGVKRLAVVDPNGAFESLGPVEADAGIHQCGPIALDSSYVYWAALLGNGLVPNQIYRIPK